MKKNLVIAILLCVLTLSITACQSKEDKVLSDLESIYNRLNNSENFTDEDWTELLTEYEVVHEEAQTCDFSYEQKKELGRIEGKILSKITERKTQELGSEIGDIINSGGALIGGFIEGLQEELEKETE